ncbi:MAG: calcium/sodium antiporter [Planctomycetota bacterium]
MDAILQVEQLVPLWLRFAAGFVVLIGGAEFLVRGASRLAAGFGIKPLVIGLTVVSFGTSAPELAVSVGSSLTGNSDVAVGNIVGSNVMNILLVLGLAALVAPLVVRDQLVRLDVPLLIVVSFLVWIMAADGIVSHVEGFILFGGLIAYLLVVFQTVRKGGKAAAVPTDDVVDAKPVWWRDVGLVFAGLVGLTIGARWLVDGAVAAAEAMNVSQLVIGLTIVAIGTSLPEIATSVLASIRGERDLAVGNVVGSNLFNLLCVLGLTAALPPEGVPVSTAAINFDLPVMCAVAVLCFPIFFTKGRISRGEGLLMLGYFAAYMAYLLLDATGHEAVTPLSWVMLAFVVPLTVIGLTGAAVLSFRERLQRRERLMELREARAGSTS